MCSTLEITTGDSSKWVDPQGSWQSNAVSSLNRLINTYGLNGIDLNYENTENGWSGFASNWCTVFSTLQSQHSGIVFTVAPFAGEKR